MLKKLDAKVESAIRTAALKEFTDDFETMGELVSDVFEVVRVKHGYTTGAGTPTDEIYEATRRPLAAVKLMIATGKEPQDEIHSGYQSAELSRHCRVNRNIRMLANAYLIRAESDFADRMLEVVRAIKGAVKPERIVAL